VQQLGKIFEIHPLTQEDMLNHDQRPKIEDFGQYLYIVLQKPFIRLEEQRVEMEQVSIILCNGIVVSWHDQTETAVAAVRGRMIQEKARIKKYGACYLAYVLIDNIVDDYFATMEQCEEIVQDLEQDTVTRPTEILMRSVHKLKQEMVVIRKSVWPLREVVSQMEKLESVLVHKNLKFYLKDLQDHIIQILDLIELFRDMLGGMVETNLSIMSHQMGKVMKTLTMIASLFIPLTLVTGIYGMNFDYMPELHWKYGYPAVLVLLAVIAAAMVYYFKKQKWL
jgi:magnesium transporter